MSKLKKLAACGLIIVLSLGVSACSSNTSNETETKTEAGATTEETGTEANGSDLLSKEDPAKVIAKVNGVEVYQKEANELYDMQVAQLSAYFGVDYLKSEEGQAYLESLMTSCVENVISKEVVYQKAEELNISTTDEEVSEMVEKEKTYFESEEAFNEAVKEYYGSDEEMRAYLNRAITVSKVAEYMEQGAEATDEEVEAYYNENIANYTTGAGANMKHILVFTDSDKAEDEAHLKEREELAKEIKVEIDNGASFDEVFKKYQGEDIDSELYVAEDLGFVQYEEPGFDPLFLAGTPDLKEGEVSEPVKSSFGYHIIQATGLKEEEVKPLEEVKESIVTAVEETEKNKLFEEKLNAWVSEANIERF